ncbi:MAG: hypothetical protein HFJ40_03615 [Clostridia bacterium]|nr:hypothetical protein [Clostridia bacterium]
MKEKVKKEKKENKTSKFVEIIKKKWLINGTKTFILIAVIIAIFILINLGMQKLELTPIDFSQEKLYTLTDESKDRVKNIDKDVNVYFIGYTDDNTNLDLAKQYKKVNEKINVEAVDINNRPDLATKYGIESGTEGIIVECGDKSKVLTENDLVTYDTSTYETISIAEEKLTSAIISVTSNKVPKVYFLEGYSEFSLNGNMNYLNMYLANEINEIETLNILSTGKIPEDCDTLVITTPSKDFDDVATNSIIDYINSGKNILWLNAAVTKQVDMPNVNKILSLYGVNPFNIGIIRETDSSKMVSDSPDLIIPEIKDTTVTKDLHNTTGVIFVNATKINIDTDKLEELKVDQTDLLVTSEDSYFRTNFNNQSSSATEDEEKGTFVVGTQLDKTIKEENEETGEKAIVSKLIIYGENYFISDYQLSQNSQYGAIQLAYNKDLPLNSISYLVDREEDITARKNTGTITYTATEEQDTIIRVVIFVVPVLIIIAGVVIWQIRRRKK